MLWCWSSYRSAENHTGRKAIQNSTAAEDKKLTDLEGQLAEMKVRLAAAEAEAAERCTTPELMHPSLDKTPIEELLECELCLVCLDAKKQTTFVHGDTGHSCCCMECAKLFEETETKAVCPLCRCSIERIIRQY